MRQTGAILLVTLSLAGCDPQPPATEPGAAPSPPTATETPMQPVVNVGIGVGASGVHAYGGVGFFQGPFGLYLGF